MESLGTFETTGKLMVSDPCYKVGTWCQGELDVLPGTYECFLEKEDMGSWGVRCARLFIFHSAVPENTRRFLMKDLSISWQNSNLDICVDGGTAGFFDRAKYPESEEEHKYKNGTWYRNCCDKTHNDTGFLAGVVDGGVVSASGDGDGSYPCFVFRSFHTVENVKENIVALYLNFYPEEGEEGEEEFDFLRAEEEEETGA